eukprot:1466863-Prymnesium_polylepis.1
MERQERLDPPEREEVHLSEAREVHHVEVQVEKRERLKRALHGGRPFDLVSCVHAQELQDDERDLKTLVCLAHLPQHWKPEQHCEERDEQVSGVPEVARYTHSLIICVRWVQYLVAQRAERRAVEVASAAAIQCDPGLGRRLTADAVAVLSGATVDAQARVVPGQPALEILGEQLALILLHDPVACFCERPYETSQASCSFGTRQACDDAAAVEAMRQARACERRQGVCPGLTHALLYCRCALRHLDYHPTILLQHPEMLGTERLRCAR